MSYVELPAEKVSDMARKATEGILAERKRRLDEVKETIRQRWARSWFRRLFRHGPLTEAEIAADMGRIHSPYYLEAWAAEVYAYEDLKVAKNLACAAKHAPIVYVSASDLRVLTTWGPE